MPWTWKALLTSGFSSTLTLARTTCPSVPSTTVSRIGPSWRQGPHHGAQRSTTTGVSWERFNTSASKVASVTSIMGRSNGGAASDIPGPPRSAAGMADAGARVGLAHPRPQAAPSWRTMATPQDTEGIDVDGVTAWFEGHVPSVVPPLAFDLIAGGHSNLTYRVTD